MHIGWGGGGGGEVEKEKEKKEEEEDKERKVPWFKAQVDLTKNTMIALQISSVDLMKKLLIKRFVDFKGWLTIGLLPGFTSHPLPMSDHPPGESNWTPMLVLFLQILAWVTVHESSWFQPADLYLFSAAFKNNIVIANTQSYNFYLKVCKKVFEKNKLHTDNSIISQLLYLKECEYHYS